MKKRRGMLKIALKIIFSIGLLAFIEGFLTQLTGELEFIFILPMVFIIIAFIISLIV
jgi:hypothetical protein